MRNKGVVLIKLERLGADIKMIGYLVRRMENDEAFNKVGTILEKLEDIVSLLNSESQD